MSRIYLSPMSIVEVKRYFTLVQPQFKTLKRYGCNSFGYQAGHHWNLLDNCYKDPTALANWQPDERLCNL